MQVADEKYKRSVSEKDPEDKESATEAAGESAELEVMEKAYKEMEAAFVKVRLNCCVGNLKHLAVDNLFVAVPGALSTGSRTKQIYNAARFWGKQHTLSFFPLK